MTRQYIPFLAFIILLLLTIPGWFDFSTSVVPGWHTTIFPPYFIWGIIIMIALLFFTIGYWLSSKRADRITWTLYAIHFVCTIPAIIYLKFPAIFFNGQITHQDTLIKAIELRMKIIPIVFTLFIAGQILFPIYYARTINAKRTTM